MGNDWYQLDEKENDVDFLEAAALFFAGSHPHKWKWLAISLDGALYGFAVLATEGTDSDRVKRGQKLVSLREALNPLLLSEEILTQPLDYGEFSLALPSGPGLGIELDEDRLDRFRRDRRERSVHPMPGRKTGS